MMQALCTDLDRAGQVAFLETDKPENPDEGHQLGGGFMVSSPSRDDGHAPSLSWRRAIVNIN